MARNLSQEYTVSGGVGIGGGLHASWVESPVTARSLLEHRRPQTDDRRPRM